RLAALLVEACLDLARQAGGTLLRMFVPTTAVWLVGAVRAAGLTPVRSVYHMLLPAEVAVEPPTLPPEVRVRSIRAGEEMAVLAALNRAWHGTWGFVPIRLEMLESDLEGQRQGMLLAVDAADDARILATVHAVFDPDDRNPDGHPRAWISNLTVDPDHRGRGLGRAMLLAGLSHLRSLGARSITLGVDAGDPAPLRLYRSIGFEPLSTLEAWETRLAG
ncbi:MAG: GNAT family N-acetyltransferase, partial [Chloroflexota bacterium]|nr:GNAT family N-acetyltransferase [Chloroflexota bacterium]